MAKPQTAEEIATQLDAASTWVSGPRSQALADLAAAVRALGGGAQTRSAAPAPAQPQQ